MKDKRLNMNEMNAKACKHERSRYQGGCKRSERDVISNGSRDDGELVLDRTSTTML